MLVLLYHMGFFCILAIERKGITKMNNYTFTVFEKTGKLLVEEKWEFSSDEEAKRLGEKRVEEQGYADSTHRLVNTAGKLVLFHV